MYSKLTQVVREAGLGDGAVYDQIKVKDGTVDGEGEVLVMVHSASLHNAHLSIR